jgi:hypothetical protein
VSNNKRIREAEPTKAELTSGSRDSEVEGCNLFPDPFDVVIAAPTLA